jgi:hypothetical protein
VPVNPQLPDLRFKGLPGSAQLGSRARRPADHALGLPQCAFNHFPFTFRKVCDQRLIRRRRPGTTVRSIPASHASMVSRPKEVTDIITSAAESARPKSAKATHP